jgi:hypothetical protein
MAVQKDGFVAMLDILGFSEQILKGQQPERLDNYVKTVLSVCSEFQDVKVILFSDTVTLYTLDQTDAAFGAIVVACSRLLHDLLLEQDIALRGAITAGRFSRSEGQDGQDGNAVIAGLPVIDAYNFESKQQWVGVMLTPSALKLKQGFPEPHPGTDPRWRSRLFQCTEIPLSSGGTTEPFDNFAVCPSGRESNSLADVGVDRDNVVEQLEKLRLLAPDPRSQAKYRNTVKWLKSIPELEVGPTYQMTFV